MTPGTPAVCAGTIGHRRFVSADHAFTNDVSMAWFDPNRPNDLCEHDRFWSAHGPAPVWFRRRDYGDHRTSPLGILAFDDLEAVLGRRPDGAVRMLTQFRRLGWLFNPITLYFVWDADDPEPVGAVLEVTNTPWKERHRYAVALTDEPLTEEPLTDGRSVPARSARFPKALHVSPFFDENFDYVLRVASGEGIDVCIDLVDADDHRALSTRLTLDRTPATHRALRRAMLAMPFSTHGVSLGIHVQAARLAAKRVRFVTHPSRRPIKQESAA